MNENQKLPKYYIAIGASAGGLEAIEQFIKNMPSNNDFGIIIIQHLSPDYKSMMLEILSKKTDIPVFKSEDGMLVEAGKIYLNPPKKNLTISSGKLVLNDVDSHGGLNFPIDLFLRSLAEDQGEKSIAVILSGTGSDGVRGIRAIKQHGGIIFVQEESSAKFDGMPRAAIATGLADFIMKPSEMPKQIISLSKYPNNLIKIEKDGVATDENVLIKIFDLVKSKHGLDFSCYKPSTIKRQLERRMAANNISDIADYLKYIYLNPSELSILFKEFLIGVTSFFRDAETFEKLEKDVIPELLNKISDREIRIWVAGCSTGEEAYTLAMIFREVIEKNYINKSIKLFATDIDKKALQFASTGAYPESITADVPVTYLSKYFIKQGNQFIISRSIRELIVFAEHNLIKDPPFTNISFISCRNLLIYLKPDAQMKVLKNFHYSLKSGGILLLGNSETIGELNSLFEVVDQKFKIYKSIGIGRPIFEYVEGKSKDSYKSINRSINFLEKYKYHSSSEMEKMLESAIGKLSPDYFDALIIVNSNFNLIYLEGNISEYFTMPRGRPIIELEKVTSKELSMPIISGIKKSFKTNTRVKYKKTIKNKNTKKTVMLDFIPFVGFKNEGYCAIILSVLNKEKTKYDDTLIIDTNSPNEERIKELENELQITRENLQATIEELETSNEELQATNEELLASNEELQSTNEELQSTNEELYTVNNELQSKIMELTDLQNDVENLLTSSNIGILMLDNELKIKKFSPKVKEVFKLIEIDVGRPITHLSHYILELDPYALFKNALKEFQHTEFEIKTSYEKYYLMRISPYRSDYSNGGIVVTFIEITHYRKIYEYLSIKDQIISAIQKVAKVGGWYYDKVNNKMYWTDEVYQIHGIDKKHFNSDPALFIERSLICYGDKANEVMELFNKCLSEGIPYDITVPFKKYTGESIMVKTTGNPDYKDGKIVGVVGTITDLTSKETK